MMMKKTFFNLASKVSKDDSFQTTSLLENLHSVVFVRKREISAC